MSYIIDTSTLIVLKNHDFPFPENRNFWDWLKDLCQEGVLQIPVEVYKEVMKGDDALVGWMKELGRDSFIPASMGAPHLGRVLNVYADPMPAKTLGVLQTKADPFLIAHAIAMQAIVITDERPAPKITKPEKIKIPDVCNCLGIPCTHISRLLWDHRASLPF